ncbi:MAG: hypothetical protein JSV80_16630, partial [Acidobacteriota bacterium]
MSAIARAVLWAGLISLAAGCHDGETRRSVPTAELQPDDFEIRILAEGALEAKDATIVNVPSALGGARRIAWLA